LEGARSQQGTRYKGKALESSFLARNELASTVCFTELGKLNLPIVVLDFKLEPIFATAPAASKSETYFKNGQN
jgi:hypothetical protein